MVRFGGSLSSPPVDRKTRATEHCSAESYDAVCRNVQQELRAVLRMDLKHSHCSVLNTRGFTVTPVLTDNENNYSTQMKLKNILFFQKKTYNFMEINFWFMHLATFRCTSLPRYQAQELDESEYSITCSYRKKSNPSIYI